MCVCVFLMNKIPPNGYDTFCFSIHQVMDICTVNRMELVPVEL